MVVNSELEEVKSNQAYLVDALRFALSISPNSIPNDNSLGISIDRSSSINDVVSCRVKDVLLNIDSYGRLEFIHCYVEGKHIRVIIRNRITDELFRFSLE